MKRHILIYSIALLFITAGYMVASNHNHFEGFCDTQNLQPPCHYLKNPVGTNATIIIMTFIVTVLLPTMYGSVRFTGVILYPIETLTFKRQRLVSLSSDPHRAPPIG